MDYFLGSYLKSFVYQNKPTNLAQFKTETEENIAKISKNPTLHCA